jgi:hypothetical protein
MFILILWSFVVGCVRALLLHTQTGKALLAVLRNIQSYLGVSSTFMRLPLKQRKH